MTGGGLSEARWPLAVLVGLVYVGAASWLVGQEGQSYREALARRREAAVARVPAAPAPAPAPEPVPEIKPAPEPVAAKAAESKPEVAPAPEAKVEKPPTPASATPPSLPPAAPAWFETLDLARLTPAQEAQLGAELHALVMASNPVDREADTYRLRKAAEPILEGVNRKDVRYTFTVLASEPVNAFSLPGGYVYVSRGLLRLAGEVDDPADDNVLRFALAHEIAHVDLRHSLTLVAKGLESAKARSAPTGGISAFLLPITLGFPDAMEQAADSWAYRQLTTRLGLTRYRATQFLVLMNNYARRNGFGNGRMPPDSALGQTLLENHYRALPAAAERLERVRSAGARVPLEPRR